LDLSVQAQVLNYLKDVQEEFGLSFLFISHDLSVVQHMCKKLTIMHRARFVETGTAEDIYENPLHIYTKRLLAAVPDMNPKNRKENEEKRKEVEKDYENSAGEYYAEDMSVFDLKKINENHYVALP